MRKCVIMVGPGLEAPGGMSAVAKSYRDAGMFETECVRYVSTYERPGMVTQIRVMASALRACLPLLLSRRARLLHAHSASRGSFWRKSLLCTLARLSGVPYVLHIHSGEFPDFYERECGAAARWWVRRVLRRAASVIVLTPRWQAALAAIEPRAALRVLPNPVRVPHQLATARPAPRRVLFLGRLREKKGVFDLVDAIAVVRRSVPDVEVVLAGDGDLDAVLAAARRNDVDGAVTLPGWVDGPDKDRLLASADVFVLPSYFEGLPVGILEAMALGIPIVATTVGGIPDVLAHGEHALLVGPGDVPTLAHAITALLTDAELANRLRGNAYERAKSVYSDETVMRSLDGIYREIEGASAIGLAR